MNNASTLEIWSVVMMGIAFFGSTVGLLWLGWKYYQYRRPMPDGKRPNGTAQLIFAQSALLYIALGLLSGLLLLFSIMALFMPPPIRPEAQQQASAVTNAYIFLSLGVDASVLLNLWLTTRIDRAIRNENARKWDGHERRTHDTPPGGTKV